jgi:hypothetical protein
MSQTTNQTAPQSNFVEVVLEVERELVDRAAAIRAHLNRLEPGHDHAVDVLLHAAHLGLALLEERVGVRRRRVA